MIIKKETCNVMINAWRTRLTQLWQALTARISTQEQALVAQILPEHEQWLHNRMPRRDRRHCLDVYYTLVAGGIEDPFVLRAALFHDTGKVDRRGRAVPLLLYGGFVIFKRLWPQLYALLAASPRGWRYWFYYYAQHGPLGAELAQELGSPPEIVEILRHYHDLEPQGRAAILQWSDVQH